MFAGGFIDFIWLTPLICCPQSTLVWVSIIIIHLHKYTVVRCDYINEQTPQHVTALQSPQAEDATIPYEASFAGKTSSATVGFTMVTTAGVLGFPALLVYKYNYL